MVSGYERIHSALKAANSPDTLQAFSTQDQENMMRVFHLFMPLRIFGKLCEASDTTALQCVNEFFTLLEYWHTSAATPTTLSYFTVSYFTVSAHALLQATALPDFYLLVRPITIC